MTKKVLFYTNAVRVFRTTHIGYLYDICKKYPTILLSEKMDTDTERMLNDKSLFPNLEKIIPVDQRPGQRQNPFMEIKKNREGYKLAKEVMDDYQPNVLIAPTDIHSLFERYLFRFAKKRGILGLVIQPSNIALSAVTRKWVDYVNAYERYPRLLPFWLKLFFNKVRKELGHFFYFVFLPLSVGEKPFSRKASYILRTGNIGLGDSDYVTVFSKFFRDILLEDKIPEEKIYILAHPLIKETRGIFEKGYFESAKKKKESGKMVLLLLPGVEIGWKIDYSLVQQEERYKKWKEITVLVAKYLSGWKIVIKPHPDLKDFKKIKNLFNLDSIEITNPKEMLDKFIEIADAIIGLPLSSSSALFTASLQCPGKPILSLDFLKEVLGDYYKDYKGIEYIDNEEKLSNVLKLIENGQYKNQSPKEETDLKEFNNVAELLDYLLQIKINK